MEECVDDELADGEDDEKRIQRSDFRAGRKIKSSKGALSKRLPGKKRAQNASVPESSGS